MVRFISFAASCFVLLILYATIPVLSFDFQGFFFGGSRRANEQHDDITFGVPEPPLSARRAQQGAWSNEAEGLRL